MLAAHLLACALAGCTLRPVDVVAESAFAVELAADYAQTSGIASRCREENPVIGTCGEVIAPTVFFPIALALHVALIAALPVEWRAVVEGFSIGAEGRTVEKNALTTRK